MSEEKAREILRNRGMSEVEIQEFMEGVKKGTQAYLDGKVKPWSEIKKELGIKD